MDFDFSQQQYEFRDTLQDFLAREYPLERHIEAAGRPEIDARLWQGLAGLGLFGALVPEQHDGLGLGLVDLALAVEELGKALAPLPVFETLIGTDLLVRHGSAAQQQRWLPQLAAGRTRLALAVTEAQSGFGLANLAATARADGHGLRLAGSKILVPELASADLLLVAARGGPGHAPALVLAEPAGCALEQHTTLEITGRFHRLDLAGIAPDRAGWLGLEPSPAAAERLQNVAAAVAAGSMIGTAGRTLDIAVAYAGTREQFGRPIGSFQAIKHRCADMDVAADAGRTAAYYAAWAVAEGGAEGARAASIAKSYCGDAARFICNEAIQVHGGIGFTWELGLHHYLRRAKFLEYCWGDASFHRERVLQQTLAGLGSEH